HAHGRVAAVAAALEGLLAGRAVGRAHVGATGALRVAVGVTAVVDGGAGLAGDLANHLATTPVDAAVIAAVERRLAGIALLEADARTAPALVLVLAATQVLEGGPDGLAVGDTGRRRADASQTVVETAGQPRVDVAVLAWISADTAGVAEDRGRALPITAIAV